LHKAHKEGKLSFAILFSQPYKGGEFIKINKSINPFYHGSIAKQRNF